MSDEEGYYIYGIIGTDQRREFGPTGIGARGDVVYTLPCQGLAAIVSRSPIVKYAVTRDNSLAHARVVETVMQDYTILPARFCTIAREEKDIIERVLQARHQEFVEMLEAMTGKIELGVRARWRDLDAIFAEVVAENKEIQSMKATLSREKSEQKQYASKIKIGELVQKALEEKRKREKEELIEALRPFSFDCKEGTIYGDMNLVNAAFLVAKERERAFDRRIQELEVVYGERKQLKYVGPVAPYNFVEVVINW